MKKARSASDSAILLRKLASRIIRSMESQDDSDGPDAEMPALGLPAFERADFIELLRTTTLAREQLRAPQQQPTEAHHRGQFIAGRYLLEGELGVGGFGCVWRAWDRILDRRVAIKFISLLTGGELQRFQTEVQALVRCGCTGLQIFDVGTHEDSAYLVLELVNGRPLSHVLEDLRSRGLVGFVPSIDDLRIAIRHNLRPGDPDLIATENWFQAAARICIAALRTVETLHNCGIRHRDIKPSNLLLRGGGIPVLIDFGLAIQCGEHPRPSEREGLSGSLAYLAPEQIENRRTGIDERTDVYQVGLLLYEFCTLQPAFDGGGSEAPVSSMRDNSFRSPRSICSGIPRALERICLYAMAADPQSRYQTATSFRIDLERWLVGKVAPIALQGTDLNSRFVQALYVLRGNSRLALLALGSAFGGAAAAIFAMTT